MDISTIIRDKTIKAKAKPAILSKHLLEKKISIDELLDFIDKAKDPDKATCIEAIEFATKEKPAIAGKKCFDAITKTLAEEAPRVKWESAKVIGNIAHLFADKLDIAIRNLLANTEHEGTVVRWSAAFALGEIIKLKTKHNKKLIPAIENIADNEEKNSIKKIFLDALKKAAG